MRAQRLAVAAAAAAAAADVAAAEAEAAAAEAAAAAAPAGWDNATCMWGTPAGGSLVWAYAEPTGQTPKHGWV